MTKVPQSTAELAEHLTDHLMFLRASAAAFDEGREGEAKRLAVSLRVLFHDTKSSHSLLGQLNRLSGQFLSTAIPNDPGNVLTHGGLVMIAASGRGSKYVAMLDEVPYTRWLPFAQWWEEEVFVDDRRNILTRRDLVLAVANQDGGAHVDPNLNEVYARLSRHNSLGWVYAEGTAEHSIPGAERAAIRQISHEALRTLLPTYCMKNKHQPDAFTGGAMIHMGGLPQPVAVASTIGRNDRCPCGSGRKHKHCHGAPSRA